MLGTLAAGQASASGFQLREQSVKNLGKSNAGSIVGKDASNVSLNPAAMTNLDKVTIQSDLTVIDLSASFSGGGSILGSPAPSAALTGGNGGDPGDPTLVPNMAVVFPMHGALEGMTLGASIGLCFYPNDASDPATDGVSFGAGLVYERADVTLSKAIDFGTAICASGNPANCFNPQYPFKPQQLDGGFEVSGSDTAVGYLVGMQVAPNDKLAIGFSYRSEIKHDLAGNLDFQNVPALLGADPRFQDGPGGAKMVTPSVTTLSISYGITDQLRVLGDYQGTGWSSLQDVTIRRSNGTVVGSEDFSWEDTDFFSVGMEYDLSDAFTLRGGIGWDESPTNDVTRTPRLPDNDRMLYSVGMSWAFSDNLTVDAAYQRIEIDDPTIDLGVHVPSDLSTLHGTFGGYANLFGVSMQYRF